MAPETIPRIMPVTAVVAGWALGERFVWTFALGGAESRVEGRVHRVEEGRLLGYDFVDPHSRDVLGIDNVHRVTIELADDRGGTRVTVLQDANLSETARAHAEGGWRLALNNLKGLVEREEHRDYWDANAKNYDRSMSLLGRPMPRMIELAGEAARGATRVLEVAAGTGLVTPALAAGAGEVVATDYSPAMVAELERRVQREGLGNVRCERADLYALRFEEGAFDVVVAANVLHLVPDLPGAFEALRRVSKPGGKLVVPTFCHDETVLSWLASRVLALTGFPGHRRFTAQSLRRAVGAAGVRVTRTELLPGLIPIGYVEGTFEKGER